jgi:hypothetical protein
MTVRELGRAVDSSAHEGGIVLLTHLHARNVGVGHDGQDEGEHSDSLDHGVELKARKGGDITRKHEVIWV